MTDTATPAPAGGEALSVSAAASLLGKRATEQATETTGDEAALRSAPAEHEPAGDEAAVAEASEPPGETAETDDEAEQPPIDPPRTWPKAQKEIFRTLPREHQEKLVEIESARDREIQKGLQANAERERALEVDRQAIAQARQQYEAVLPQVQQMLQGQFAKFQDIKTWDDVQQLRVREPARYLEWDALTKQAQAVSAEAQRLNGQKAKEAADWFQGYVAKEDAKFIEAFPDYADGEKGPRLQAATREVLADLGFADDELAKLWTGERPILARDHRFQKLVAEVATHRAARKAAQAAKDAAKAKTLPPVTRPGTAEPKGSREAAVVKELQSKLARTGKVDDAARLMAARRAN